MEAPARLAQHAGRAQAGGGWDWPRTLVARGAATLTPAHLRQRSSQTPPIRLHCFVLDCSASMASRGALARAKGVLLSLLEQAYRRRDQVALICFGGTQAELRLSPRKAAAWNDDWIAPIRGGGGTPLRAAVSRADDVLSAHAGKAQGWLWLLTDGRTREVAARPPHAEQAWVIDFEEGPVRLHRAEALAAAWQAHHAHASDWAMEGGAAG